MLSRERCFEIFALLFNFAVLFQKLIEQHRVHRLVAHGVNLSFLVASHQSGIYLFHFLGDETELCDPLGVNLLLLTEGDWP